MVVETKHGSPHIQVFGGPARLGRPAGVGSVVDFECACTRAPWTGERMSVHIAFLFANFDRKGRLYELRADPNMTVGELKERLHSMWPEGALRGGKDRLGWARGVGGVEAGCGASRRRAESWLAAFVCGRRRLPRRPPPNSGGHSTDPQPAERPEPGLEAAARDEPVRGARAQVAVAGRRVLGARDAGARVADEGDAGRRRQGREARLGGGGRGRLLRDCVRLGRRRRRARVWAVGAGREGGEGAARAGARQREAWCVAFFVHSWFGRAERRGRVAWVSVCMRVHSRRFGRPSTRLAARHEGTVSASHSLALPSRARQHSPDPCSLGSRDASLRSFTVCLAWAVRGGRPPSSRACRWVRRTRSSASRRRSTECVDPCGEARVAGERQVRAGERNTRVPSNWAAKDGRRARGNLVLAASAVSASESLLPRSRAPRPRRIRTRGR